MKNKIVLYRYTEGNVQFEKNEGGHETLVVQDFCKGQTTGADHYRLWARGKPGYSLGWKSVPHIRSRWTSVLMPDTREGVRVSELNFITCPLIHRLTPTYSQQHIQQTRHSPFVHHVEDIRWAWASKNILTIFNAPIPLTCSETSFTWKWRRAFWLYSIINVQILFLKVMGKSTLTSLHILPSKEPANHNLIPR